LQQVRCRGQVFRAGSEIQHDRDTLSSCRFAADRDVEDRSIMPWRGMPLH